MENYSLIADVQDNSKIIAGIAINYHKVLYNMDNDKLTAEVHDKSKNIAGISETKNITVLNGRLINMCYYGIYAQSVTNLTIENITIDGLSFSNLKIRQLTPSGISISQTKNITITNVRIQNINVTSDSCAGIQLYESSKIEVTDCYLNNFVNNDGGITGFLYIFCEVITTKNCNSSGFQTSFNGNIYTLGHTVLGFCPIFCIDLKYEDCTATYLIGCCDDCHGMSLFLVAFITINNFRAKNIIDGIAKLNSGAKATGIEVYGVEVTVSDSFAENVIAIQPQDKQSAGFSATGMLISFNNCEARDILVLDEHGKTYPELGYGTGFGWAPDPRPDFCYLPAMFIAYNNCKSINCQVGFDTWYHINSTWKGIDAKNCYIKILNEPEAIRTLSGDPCSECNPPIQVSLTNIADNNVYPNLNEKIVDFLRKYNSRY